MKDIIECITKSRQTYYDRHVTIGDDRTCDSLRPQINAKGVLQWPSVLVGFRAF